MSLKRFPQSQNKKEWREGLKEYLEKELVPSIIPEGTPKTDRTDYYRKVYTSDEALKIWEIVFTHPSYDRTVNRNFEIHEYLGDRQLSFRLGQYIRKLDPNADQATLTDYNISFTSRGPLAVIAREKGMLEHVLTLEELKGDKKQSDIFEAVVNGITDIGDRLISPGVGDFLAATYLVGIYNWFRSEFSRERGKSGVINRVMQNYYEALGWKSKGMKNKPFQIWNPEEKEMSIRLNNKAIQFFKTIGKGEQLQFIETYQREDETEGILARGRGEDKAEATENAYYNALKKLKSTFGINENEARQIGLELFIEQHAEKPQQLLTQIEKKNRRNNIMWYQVDHFDSVPFQTPSGTEIRGKKVYNLHGHNQNGLVGLLYRIMFSGNPKKRGWTDDQIRLTLYQKYAQSDQDYIEPDQYYYYKLGPRS